MKLKKWSGKKETKQRCLKQKKWLPISDAFDSYGAFLKLHDVKHFGEFVIKIHQKNLVLQNKPSMFNEIKMLQNIFYRSPVVIDGTFIFK